MTETARIMDGYLQENLDRYIEETARLCAQPSVSAKGEGIAECAELVLRLLEEHGVPAHKIHTAGHPVVVGHLPGQSERTLLLYNHYDVQPPEPLELWTTPPFEPTVRDGRLYARGTADDKGEFVARLAAVDAVRAAHGGTLPCGATFVVEGEEEIGSIHIAQFVREHRDLLRSQAAIWEVGGVNPDGRPEMTLGVRGILSVELSLETMTADAHSAEAHVLPNAAWRLLWALHSLKGQDEQILIPGFYDAVKPPTQLDQKLLDELPVHEEAYRQLFGVKEFVLGRKGGDLHRAVFEPTCNICGLTAGYQGPGTKTIIPARASAKVDFRLVPDQDPDDILARLCAYLDAQGFSDVQVTSQGAMWPAKTPADDSFVRLTIRTGEQVYGHPAVIDPLAGGSSPIYAFAGPLGGIPVVFAGIGYWANRAHAPDEHIRIEDFLQGTRHIARILDGFAGT